jgi:hypothetical protein
LRNQRDELDRRGTKPVIPNRRNMSAGAMSGFGGKADMANFEYTP